MLLGKNLTEKLAVFIATWGYSGFIPPVFFRGMAGTYGSFFSLPLVIGVLYLSKKTAGLGGPDWFSNVYVLSMIYVYVLGMLTVSLAEKVIGPRKDWHGKEKVRDQNQIVIDEVFGMLVTCYPIMLIPVELFSASGALLIFLGFLFFRFFDIVKVYPTKIFDRQHSAFGVMMDDWMAGIYASVLLHIVSLFIV